MKLPGILHEKEAAWAKGIATLKSAAAAYAKAAALLPRGGHLAVWAADHAFPAGFDPFFTEIQKVYDALGEGDVIDASSVAATAALLQRRFQRGEPDDELVLSAQQCTDVGFVRE